MGGRDPLPCQKPAIALANEIVYAKKQRKTPSPPRFNILNLFERQAGLLEITKGISISKGLAKFAVQIYAQRDRVCHSGLQDYESEGQAQNLQKTFSADCKEPSLILPGCGKKNQCFYEGKM